MTDNQRVMTKGEAKLVLSTMVNAFMYLTGYVSSQEYNRGDLDNALMGLGRAIGMLEVIAELDASEAMK